MFVIFICTKYEVIKLLGDQLRLTIEMLHNIYLFYFFVISYILHCWFFVTLSKSMLLMKTFYFEV